MGIWIMDQNKEKLIECSTLEIGRKGDMYNIFANYNYCDGAETYEVLGTYSTKRKALKVLNMIKKHIEIYNLAKIDFKKVCFSNDYEFTGKEMLNMFDMPQDDEVLEDVY